MATPKITISLDQSILNTFTRLSDSVNQMCDEMERLASALKTGIPLAEHCPEPEARDTEAMNEPSVPVPTIPEPSAPALTAPVIPEPAAPAFTLPTAQVNPIAAPAIPVQAVPVTPSPVQMPTQAQEITLERLAVAGAELMQRGINSPAILAEFGVKAVSELPKEQYDAFALRLRQLGANI